MRLKGLFFALIWVFAGSFTAFAHPLDISVSVIDIDTENQNISISTYLHPFEVGFLLEKIGIQSKNLNEAFDHKEEIFKYIQDSVVIKNNGQLCNFVSANIPPKDEFEIMGDGLEIQYEAECIGEINILGFSNTLFIEDFELQTNKMIFFKNGALDKNIYEAILTSKVYNDSFDFNNPSVSLNAGKDTDQDGLTDSLELKSYFTSEKLPDTDFDGYSDKEEVDKGWDPLDPLPSPGQIKKNTIKENKDASFEYLINEGRPSPVVVEVEKQKIPRKTGNNDTLKTSVVVDFLSTSSENEDKKEFHVTSEESSSENSEVTGSTFFKTDRLKKYLIQIKALFDSDSFLAKLLIFVLVFSLGALHSLEAGHGKTILASYLLEEDKQLKDAGRFSAYLTITHLIDVIFLAVLFKVFSLVGDGYKYVSVIQKIGAYMLLLIAGFLLVRSIFPSLIKNPFKGKKGPALAIIAGLAPCTFGWAIMITTISLNKINWLIPMIIVFGLGIFFSLMILSVVVLKVKNRITQKSSNLAKYSSVISASMLFVIAVILTINT